MTDQHSITPPPELVEQWADVIHQLDKSFDWSDLYIATQAANWGANQELEACCGWLSDELAAYLRDRRRPNQPSLKEQALAELEATERCHPADYSTIRRALEALPDD